MFERTRNSHWQLRECGHLCRYRHALFNTKYYIAFQTSTGSKLRLYFLPSLFNTSVNMIRVYQKRLVMAFKLSLNVGNGVEHLMKSTYQRQRCQLVFLSRLSVGPGKNSFLPPIFLPTKRFEKIYLKSSPVLSSCVAAGGR